MAINIYREPNDTSTPYSPVYFDVSSDLGTITSMIADVYVNSTLVGTFNKEPLLGTTDSFRFEVGEVLKKHFTNDLTFTGIGGKALRNSNGSALSYYIRAFEVLDNGTTFDTSWSEDGAGTNYSQSTTLKAFDGVIHHNQDLNDYICNTTSDKMLTNRPFIESVDSRYKTSKFFIGREFELGFLSEQVSQFRYQEFDSDFTQLLDTSYSNITPNNNKAFYQHDGTFTSGTRYIRFRVWDNTSNPIDAPHIYEVVTPCVDSKTIYWKNQYGCYDYYVFEGNYKKSATSRKKTYEKRLDFGANNQERGETVRLSDNKERFTIYTKTENYRTIDWLHEILQSTDVYLYDDSRGKSYAYFPIVVTGGSSPSLNDDDVITQFSLTYELANKKQSQLG